MSYFKSSGFFCLFFVFIFWFLNITFSIFISNSQITTILIYFCLAAVSLVYLLLCGRNIVQTLRLHKVNVLSLLLILVLSAVIRPLTGFVSLAGNLLFQDIVSSSITEELSHGLGIMLHGSSSGNRGRTDFPRCHLFRHEKGKPDQGNSFILPVFRPCPHEFSAVLLCFCSWNHSRSPGGSYRQSVRLHAPACGIQRYVPDPDLPDDSYAVFLTHCV